MHDDDTTTNRPPGVPVRCGICRKPGNPFGHPHPWKAQTFRQNVIDELEEMLAN